MKSRFCLALLVALFLSGAVLQAASGYSLQAPVLGHVLDAEAGSLHRVDGIPGASSIGDALALDFVVARASVAPSQDFAIVNDAEGRILVVNLRVSPPTAVELTEALAGAEGAVISPASLRAALYSAATGKVQLLNDLTGTPSAGETLDLPQGVGEWTAFAISDRGVVLAAAAQAQASSLYALSPGFGTARIGAFQRISDLAFFAGRDDAVVADTAANEVVMIRGVIARRQSSVIASANDDIANPFGVGVTADGKYVAVAVPGGVASIPVFGGVPVFTACACAPTSLVPLAGGDVFQLTEDIRAPMRIAEVGARSRVLFVPALPQVDSVALE